MTWSKTFSRTVLLRRRRNSRAAPATRVRNSKSPCRKRFSCREMERRNQPPAHRGRPLPGQGYELNIPHTNHLVRDFRGNTGAATATTIPIAKSELVTLRLSSTIKSPQAKQSRGPVTGHVGTGALARPGRAKPGAVFQPLPSLLLWKKANSRDRFSRRTPTRQEILRSRCSHGIQRNHCRSAENDLPARAARETSSLRSAQPPENRKARFPQALPLQYVP